MNERIVLRVKPYGAGFEVVAVSGPPGMEMRSHITDAFELDDVLKQASYTLGCGFEIPLERPA